MDGVILLGFILGFPANEIVIPVIIMCYMSSGTIMEMENMHALKLLLTDNGWNWVTALCTMIFILFHFPCSTTCLTIKKETGSLKMDCCRFYSSDSLRCSDMFYYFLFGETYRNRCMKIIPNEKLYKILSKRLEQYYFLCYNNCNCNAAAAD